MTGTAALLVIDVQRGYFEGTPGLHEPDRFPAVLADLLRRARAADMPGICTRYVGERATSSSTAPRHSRCTTA